MDLSSPSFLYSFIYRIRPEAIRLTWPILTTMVLIFPSAGKISTVVRHKMAFYLGSHRTVPFSTTNKKADGAVSALLVRPRMNQLKGNISELPNSNRAVKPNLERTCRCGPAGLRLYLPAHSS